MEIKPKNVYLLKKPHLPIFEWECISVSEKAYKFFDVLNERLFWIEKDEITEPPFTGYHVIECIFDYKNYHQERFSKLINSMKNKKNDDRN